MKEIFEFLVEIIFPSKRVEKKVRKMCLEDFLRLRKVEFDEEKKLWSLFNYKNPLIREAIWQMKYRRNKKVANTLALVIEDFLLEELVDLNLFEGFKKPLLVPIPMLKKEKKDRGFNQIEMLIEELVKLNPETYEYSFHCLKKVRNTKRQAELNRYERLENVKDVFCAGEKTRGRNIILIDDVRTTGATLDEARKTLTSAGAKNVLSVVIAR